MWIGPESQQRRENTKFNVSCVFIFGKEEIVDETDLYVDNKTRIPVLARNENGTRSRQKETHCWVRNREMISVRFYVCDATKGTNERHGLVTAKRFWTFLCHHANFLKELSVENYRKERSLRHRRCQVQRTFSCVISTSKKSRNLSVSNLRGSRTNRSCKPMYPQ